MAIKKSGFGSFANYMAEDGNSHKKYCKKCLYDLHGISENKCPECGTQYDPGNPMTYSLSQRPKIFKYLPQLLLLPMLWMVLSHAWMAISFRQIKIVYDVRCISFGLILPVGIFIALLTMRAPRDYVLRVALASLCALAPLSLFFPWYLAVSSFRLQEVYFLYFLHWLTRYPNLGGVVNYEVLCALILMFSVSLLPVLYGMLYINGVKLKYLWIIFLLVAVSDAIIFVNLDKDLLISGIRSFASDGSLVKSIVGPAIRLMMLGIMFMILILELRQRNQTETLFFSLDSGAAN